MSVIILILLIIAVILIWSSLKKLHNLSDICKTTNKGIKKIANSFDINTVILKSQKEQLQELVDGISRIIFGNEDSLVKVSKIIELLRKYNNSISK